MSSDAILLGRALTAVECPLTVRKPTGELLAVLPQGGAYPPHVLGVGSTRGGKTSALRYFKTGLVRSVPAAPKLLHLADGKYAGNDKYLRGQPGVVAAANTQAEIAEMVEGFHEQVVARYAALDQAKERAFQTGRRVPYEIPVPQYLIIDEFMHWSLDLPERLRKTSIDCLVRIGAIGGEVDCRLWIWTQRPDSARAGEAGLPGRLKSLLLNRMAQTGLVGMHPLEARMAFGDDDAAAARRIEAYADRAGLADRRGLGMIQVGRYEVAYKANWMADPLDPKTSDADREAAWRLLPRRPGQAAA